MNLLPLNNDANKYTLNLISNYNLSNYFHGYYLICYIFHCFIVNESGIVNTLGTSLRVTQLVISRICI